MLEHGWQREKEDHHNGAVLLGYEKLEAHINTCLPCDLQRLVRT